MADLISTLITSYFQPNAQPELLNGINALTEELLTWSFSISFPGLPKCVLCHVQFRYSRAFLMSPFSIPPPRASWAPIQTRLNSSIPHLMYHSLGAILKAVISSLILADKCAITSINSAAPGKAANIYMYVISVVEHMLALYVLFIAPQQTQINN